MTESRSVSESIVNGSGSGSGDGDRDGGQTVPIDVLGAKICGLASRMAQTTFRWMVMIAEFDRREGWVGVGIQSCAHWLSWTCSMSPGAAREHVRVARALVDLPRVSEEMAAGRLSYSKVREITRVSDRVDEARLVELARTATASQLSRSMRGFRRADGDRGLQEQRRDATWWTDDDGSVMLSARLPAEEGAVVIAALEAARDDLGRESSVDETGRDNMCGENTEAEHKPEPISRPDAMLQWARGYLAATPDDRSGEDRTTVVVHVSAEHLMGSAGADSGAGAGTAATLSERKPRSRGNVKEDSADNAALDKSAFDRSAIPPDCCQISGVGGVTAGTAARLACDATMIGVIRGAGGVVLAHGRRRRVVSEAQRRVLAIRDGCCQFPSCRRTTHLEAHHVTHWALGGRTDLDNLILLCRFHHMACHEDGAIVAPAADSTPGIARWQFTTSDGDVFAGDRRPDGSPGWKGDGWLLWHGLDGSKAWADVEATRIRPLWAGERFDLADTVSMLFGALRAPQEEPSRQAA